MQDTPSYGISPSRPASSRPTSSRPQQERALRVKLEKIQKTLQKVVSRTVKLVPMDLPPACAAAWFGDEESDWICYPTTSRTAMMAVMHSAGHLALLHCGRARDGGRFVCIDTDVAPWHLLNEFLMLVGRDIHDWPSPLFTQDEEIAADDAASELRDKCDFLEEAFVPSQATSGHNFRCLG